MFEKITFEELKKTPAWKKGKEDFKNGTFKWLGKKIYWIKEVVSKKNWNELYSKDNSYCLLEGIDKGVLIGFCNAFVPDKCEECNPEDLRKIDIQRRYCNTMPFPLEIV